MSENRYLKWLASRTPTGWWHDSADLDELEVAMANGACGVTTNPVLVARTLQSRPEVWSPVLSGIPREIKGTVKAEAILERITKTIAARMRPVFERTGGRQGYVCAQVNPEWPGDAQMMVSMARRFGEWGKNISIKLPATAAGLEALEECAAQGLSLTVTASFTVSQVLAIAERYQKGIRRAKNAGIPSARCFAVVMVGRLDDYLRDVAMDRKAAVEELDIRQAGIAVVKRAYAIFKERGYEAILLPAAMRGTYHAVELAGADLVLSIHPSIQALLMGVDSPWEQRIGVPVSNQIINRLETIPEFVRAYEPNGLKPEEFITFGVTQRTLSQFVETGWKPVETCPL